MTQAAPLLANATRDLARFAAGLRFEHIPAPVIDHVKLCILDGLGVALFGTSATMDVRINRWMTPAMAVRSILPVTRRGSRSGGAASMTWIKRSASGIGPCRRYIGKRLVGAAGFEPTTLSPPD